MIFSQLQISNGGSDLGLFVLAVAPTIFLLWFFLNQDRYKHESRKLLTVTFILGALSTLLAAVLELILTIVFPEGSTVLGIFVYFLFEVALIEESMKYFAVRIYAYRSKLFNEPIDGLIMGVTAALGFATVENVLYVMEYGIGTALVRAIISSRHTRFTVR